ncbi:MAG TPA: 1-acyl-sn-glycerol-3-phosphate acyltransferase [Vicinamibacterales bacterium]|jgi:1-acyl-sn-glycerol-3-phosphate acyltransferase|nr:1-acyl-sn-glycerol-3-phosphate acyltransferase [Vicinamibacterales bacterium]
MSRVAVIADRDTVADPILEALAGASGIERCERLAHDPARIDAVALAPFDTIVYAPVVGDPPQDDVTAVRAICERLASAPLKQVVVVSSAAIYTANHQHVGLLEEGVFLREGHNRIADAWRQVEELGAQIGAKSGTAPPVRVTLRPAAVLDGSDYFSRLFKGRYGVTYPGHDPTLQLLSPVDLAGAVTAVVTSGVDGVFNVAPAGAIPLKKALQLAGTTRLALPRVLQNAIRTVTGTTGMTASSEQLQYIQFSWTVTSDRLRKATGFVPARTSAQAIVEVTGRGSAEGVPAYDDFGCDPPYIRRYSRHLFRWLHDYYWRVELAGLENIPDKGRGVLVGMHRGFMPFDGVMALFALSTKRNRIPRFLIHPSLTRFPFLADFMAKLGGIMACQENGDYVLQHDELLGVFPEGIRGAFTMYDKAYTLGKFGRDEFVRMALRNRAPIYPFVTVGSAEIYPILKRVDWSWFKRYTEWPFLPVVPAPFPLPTKWHTQFLAPLHIEREYGPEAADDAKTVRRISIEVRQRMQAAVDEMLLRRRSIFSGTIFDATQP